MEHLINNRYLEESSIIHVAYNIERTNCFSRPHSEVLSLLHRALENWLLNGLPAYLRLREEKWVSRHLFAYIDRKSAYSQHKYPETILTALWTLEIRLLGCPVSREPVYYALVSPLTDLEMVALRGAYAFMTTLSAFEQPLWEEYEPASEDEDWSDAGLDIESASTAITDLDE